MKYRKTVAKRLLTPPVWAILTGMLLSAVLLYLVLTYPEQAGASAYLVYALSTYVLVILVIAIPRWYRQIKAALLNSRPVQFAQQTTFGSQYFSDKAFRTGANLIPGAGGNVLYMLFCFVMAIISHSSWYGVLGTYYLVLGGLRGYLGWAYQKWQYDAAGQISCYRRVAWFMFLLNVTMAGVIFAILKWGSMHSYPGLTIYAAAAYTFYAFTISIINLVKSRKLGSPILSAGRIIGLTAAMMSILGLQTAMIAAFGDGDVAFERTMNTATGIVVIAATIVLAIFMLIHAHTMRADLQNNDDQEKRCPDDFHDDDLPEADTDADAACQSDVLFPFPAAKAPDDEPARQPEQPLKESVTHEQE